MKWSRFFVLCTFIPLLLCTGRAQQGGVVGQSEREIRILQERSEWAKNQIAKAQNALSDHDFNGRDYESAFAYSKSALDALPASGKATANLRALAMETFSRASLALAQLRISEGRYEDAELVVATATGKPYDSTYAPLLNLKKDLNNPDRFNRTMTPGFISKVEQVKQLLQEAQGYYDSGRFDAAFRDYEKVLNLDPQNTAARLGMEEVNKQRSSYAETAYNERRAEMIGQVARAWELPVPKFDTGAPTIVDQSPIEMKGTSSISRKLQGIIIHELKLSDESVREAVEKIQKKSKLLDTTESDPSKKGVNIVLKLDPTQEAIDGSSKINLSLNEIPLGDALKYVAQAANLKIKIEPYAVAIVPNADTEEVLLTKEYKVKPDFFTSDISSTSQSQSSGLPNNPQTVGKIDAKDFFKNNNVSFPPKSSAFYNSSTGKLVVRNTQYNLDIIDALIENLDESKISLIEIESRFLEVTQNNVQELGFDWLLGAFNLAGGSGVYGGGGTAGNMTGNVGQFPFTQGGSATAPPIGSINGNNTGNLTAGNRTGSAAIKANALDGLLYGSPAGPAAGVLALAGIFTNPQFQVVLRAINQQKGVDLVASPKITVKNNYEATITIARQFPYPDTFSPPQISQSQGGGVSPAIPATPSNFKVRPVGVILKVRPNYDQSDGSILLELNPQITEFQGFVNYGTPIQTIAPTYIGGTNGYTLGTKQITLTPNKIEQPIFSVREVNTRVTINDGQTVVLGGLMREDVQKVQDKTPILGDAPLIGSIFRSSSNQRIKRNLLIFVTVNLLDPAGQPLLKEVEEGIEVIKPNKKAIISEAVPGDASTASKSYP